MYIALNMPEAGRIGIKAPLWDAFRAQFRAPESMRALQDRLRVDEVSFCRSLQCP
jgi:hypothetical protein